MTPCWRTPRFKRGLDFLGASDVSGMSQEAHTAFVGEVISRADRLAPCRWAVVVSSPAEAALVRLWSGRASASGVRIAPFLSAAEAADWLASLADHSALGTPV